ncbi:hypothetical protein PIB30_073763 [Stylosanthes scabra]|uniref:Uncharacterized protein n=1 Tax=Stylosanthes scabra TaxID=79078 RepID=A0ABU6SPL0_9FABA|nr:hypothetical protein [Stylosanthes scabra]
MPCNCTCSKCSSSSLHWHARPCSNSRLMTNIVHRHGFGGGGSGGGGSFGLTSTPTSSWQLHLNTSTTPVTITRKPFSDLDDVIEALKDPTICNIGMCYGRQGADEIVASEAVERIKRRSENDSLFASIVMVTVNKNPNLTEIQHQIADKLGIRLDGGDGGYKTKKIWDNLGANKKQDFIIRVNAKRISEAIIQNNNNQQQQMKKILFIFCNLHEKLGLEKLGIASGVGNSSSGHKFIFTSESEELLANHMNSDLLFMF